MEIKYLKLLKFAISGKYEKTYVYSFVYFSMSLGHFEIKMEEKAKGKRDLTVTASGRDPVARFCPLLFLVPRLHLIFLSMVL